MYRLITFGGLAVERDGNPVPALSAQRKALAMLAVVAASTPAGVQRDRLLALLWPENSADRARGALKQMLHSMRRQLGPEEVVIGTASLCLNPAQIESDVACFTAALQAGRPDEAVVLYAGPFLDGVHVDGAPELERWADDRRREFKEQYSAAIEALARAAEANGDRIAAVEWWRRRQAADPLSSRVAVALMTALDASGDQPAAIRHARVHEILVREEFGSSADPAVAALAAALAHEGIAHPSPTGRLPLMTAAAQAASPPGTAASLIETRDRLAETRLYVDTRSLPVRSRWSFKAKLGAGLLTAATLAAAAWQLNGRSNRAAPNTALEPRTVAIAVFENRTGDTLLAPLGLMAADWVTRELARTAFVDVLDVGTLYLQGRSSNGERTDPRDVARQSGAGLVVEGRYYRTADSVWFTASIVDVAGGNVLRVVDPIGAATAAPLAAVDELQRRIAAGLGTVLDPRAKFFATPAMRPPRFDAYEEFVIAQDLYWRGAFDAAFPHFRRASELDSTFGIAAAWLTVNAAGVGRCDVVDSVATSLTARHTPLAQWERFTIANSQSRCASDWEENARLQRARLQLQPKSSHIRWTLAVAYRALSKPVQVVDLLAAIDPARDLGWMSGQGKVLYWRELAAARHSLGDYSGELADATQLSNLGGAPLAAAYFRARALAGAGRSAEVLLTLEKVETLAPEPGLAAGINGRMRPHEVATPGWVLYQVATELAAHGAPNEARAIAARARVWFERSAGAGTLSPEQTFFFAHTLALLGQPAAGRILLDSLLRVDTETVELRGAIGALAAADGDNAAARRADVWLAAQPPRFPIGMPTLYRARLAALSGDSGRALDLLEALPHGAHPNDIALLHSDPALAALRNTPRFSHLVRPRR